MSPLPQDRQHLSQCLVYPRHLLNVWKNGSDLIMAESRVSIPSVVWGWPIVLFLIL